ncbi:hypothetical protein MLD38_033354 [Melastoma candidum]|uniref:Uncharacterized protein n=1 Tax=Melastoma candidum TaxID=119954 RepID=A0ACB9M672_9MYRT|nr:hypothetical protein MLD38_033354 [Melastoma candidum]
MDYARQRVHPVDIDDAPPVMSQHYRNASPYPPSKYAMPEDQHGLPPPHYRKNAPRYHSRGHHSSSGCCLRCLCCLCCFFFLLILTVTGLLYYFYTTYSPQIPSYTVDSFMTKAFDVSQDFSLYTEFLVTVKAVNPNEHISFKYGKGSSVEVVYANSSLCKGEVPSLEQGHKNTTFIKILLKGKSEFGSGIQEALMENRNTGQIPLTVKVKVPVTIVIGELPLSEITVLVGCALVVDNVSPQKKANILSNVCTPNVEMPSSL